MKSLEDRTGNTSTFVVLAYQRTGCRIVAFQSDLDNISLASNANQIITIP